MLIQEGDKVQHKLGNEGIRILSEAAKWQALNIGKAFENPFEQEAPSTSKYIFIYICKYVCPYLYIQPLFIEPYVAMDVKKLVKYIV